jgi:hypothetical protein
MAKREYHHIYEIAPRMFFKEEEEKSHIFLFPSNSTNMTNFSLLESSAKAI